jgi:sigma-B regulation protein RsbU (phosphoserine phosphatase)
MPPGTRPDPRPSTSTVCRQPGTLADRHYASPVVEAGAVRADERLRRLEAVTDAALSRLAASDLLDELLDRVRDLLGVDTAAILLLDVHSRQLVATAAKGLEEEVRQGFRISVGRGFAGRVAETRRPVMITDVTAADVVNPILIDKGLRSLLGVPMFAGEDVVGVLHVGSFTPREFTADDVHLLQLVADRASLAGQIRSSKIDQAAGLALQRSLLPARLPAVPGVEMAARYVPGHEFGIGGDWYDVFTLPSGWLGLVIGDVSGHGLASAVVMGRIRSALRAYALISDDPAEVLTLLNRKMHHFEAGSLTTALYAMVSPDRTTILLSLAGHLPPVLATPGGGTTIPALPVDPPLGIGQPHHARRTSRLEFPAEAVLVCYTDGLVERRGYLIDDGIAHLVATVQPDSAETVCGKVMAATGAERPTDDIALLVLRRHT